jgi:hypothetical protein
MLRLKKHEGTNKRITINDDLRSIYFLYNKTYLEYFIGDHFCSIVFGSISTEFVSDNYRHK